MVFKRHQKVKLLSNPLEKDVELYTEDKNAVQRGATGTINMMLPNGRYHVRIEDTEGNELAYVAMDEEQLQAV